MVKTTLQECEPKQLIDRYFKKLSAESFKNDLPENMVSDYILNLIKNLFSYERKRKKWFRRNQKTHVSKTLRNKFMKRSKPRNKADKT